MALMYFQSTIEPVSDDDERNRMALIVLKDLRGNNKLSCAKCMLPLKKLLTDVLQLGILNSNTRRILELSSVIKRRPTLHLSVSSGRYNVEFIKVLIRTYGFSIDQKNENGETPLHLALRLRDMEIVDCLLWALETHDFVANPTNAEGLSHFHIACMRNNVPVVKHFLKHSVNINQSVGDRACSWPGFTPLHFAVKYASIDSIEILVNSGANVYAEDSAGTSPINLARIMCHKQIISMLLSVPSNDILNVPLNENLSPFHVACTKDSNPEAVANFLRKGHPIDEPVDAVSPYFAGYTPLHLAVQYQCPRIVATLVEHGAKIVSTNSEGLTPLHLADLVKNEPIVENILTALKNTCTNPISPTGLSHLHIACKRRDPLVVEDLLVNLMSVDYCKDIDLQDLKGRTPLHLAVMNKRYDTVKLLVNFGADVTVATNDHCMTALHLADSMDDRELVELVLERHRSRNLGNPRDARGLSHFHVACKFNDLETVGIFMQQGVEVNERVGDEASQWPGYGALHFAVLHDNLPLIELLLSHGADVCAKNGHGLTPLHLANRVTNSVSTIELLTKAHHDKSLNPADADGYSHFHVACTRSPVEVVEKFLDQGASIDEPVSENAEMFPGCTPLHLAVMFNRLDIAKLLLARGAALDKQDMQGLTPLHLACRPCDKTICLTFRDLLSELLTIRNLRLFTALRMRPEHAKFFYKTEKFEIVKLLLDHGADINKRDHKGRTPIFHAYLSRHMCIDLHDYRRREEFFNWPCRFEKFVTNTFHSDRRKIVQALYERGAQVSDSDNDGHTVLHLTASLQCHEDFVELEKTILESFLDQKIDVNARIHGSGLTALHIASVNKHETLVRTLLASGADVNCRDTENSATPLHLAALYNQHTVVNILLNSRNNRANVNAVDRQDRTALHNAVISLYRCERWKKLKKMLVILIRRGVNVDARDKDGNTALHLCVKNYIYCIKVLLDNGADINIENRDGMTPLMLCCENQVDHIFGFIKEIEKLKTLGLPVNVKTEAAYANLLSPSNCSRLAIMTKWHKKSLFRQQSRYSDYLNQWEKEIEEMKKLPIGGNRSLFDVLYLTESRMVYHLQNRKLLGILFLRELRTKFRNFYNLMRSQLRRALERQALLVAAERVVKHLLVRQATLPHICCRQIIDYLKNEDLYVLIKACKLEV